MKPIEIAERDRFGRDRAFTIRRDEACGKMSLAEIDPDFGFESSCGVFDSETAASKCSFTEGERKRHGRGNVH